MKLFSLLTIIATLLIVSAEAMASNVFLSKPKGTRGNSYEIISNSPNFDYNNLDKVTCWMINPNGYSVWVEPNLTMNALTVTPKSTVAGLHDIYLYSDFGVKDRVKYHMYAKEQFSLFFRRAPQNSNEEPIEEFKSQSQFIVDNTPILNFEFLDVSPENTRKTRYTGSVIPLKITYNKIPQSNVKLTVTSPLGWEKIFISDQDGLINLDIIKDQFGRTPRQIGAMSYKIALEYEKSVAEKLYDKELYTLTSTISVYSNPNEWFDRATGYYVFTFSFLAIICFFVWYKMRKRVV